MIASLALALVAIVAAPHDSEPAAFTTPLDPFKISGNLYYVGSRDLAAYLVVTPKGNILINANLVSSPAQIRHSIEQLGFHWADTKILLNSQAHYDHSAGAAEVVAETHARYMVMDGDVEAITTGGAADFDQTLKHFPPVHVDRTLHDTETVTLGGTTLTAHKTAGHTRGCTTWTMQTHDGGRTLNVVIVGGWSANPAVALVPSHGKPASYPGIASDFDHTFATLKALPCDIFLGAHGVYFDLLAKHDRLATAGPSVWIDPDGYAKAVAEHEADYAQDLARQKNQSAPATRDR
jgi:metallo-beta-lactamase class B